MSNVVVEHPAADPVSLDPTSIVASARRMVAAKPDEPLWFLDGLWRLIESLDAHAGLTVDGRARARAGMVAALVTQIRARRLTETLAGPGEPPLRPVFVTGLLRTGTTFLQQLLAHHPDLRSPRLWELMSPADPAEPAALVAACDAYVEEYYRVAPRFRQIHPLGADLPEECHRLTANSFQHPIYALRYHVPGYVEWLRGRSMVPAYQFHRTQLRCLLWRRPGNPVVLKCPSHLWHLDALGEVYPDATVIRLHRCPSVALPSVCSLTAVVRAARSHQVDREEIGRYWLAQATIALAGMRFQQSPLQTPPLDVRYADLVADPLGVVARACDHIGVTFTDEARHRMSVFLRSRSGQTPGDHQYTAEEFGLSRDQLVEHFAGYRAEFGL